MRSVFVDEPKLPIALYSSSLLLIYDETRTNLVVKLVDFAHWRSAPEANDPSGVVRGLDTLIDTFSRNSSSLSSKFDTPLIEIK